MMKVQEIGPLKILFGKHSTYPYCNTLFIKGQRTLLVDPACEEQPLRALAENEKIDILFNTHYHPDHIRYNALFEDVEFLAHRADAPCFRSLDSMAEWVGVKGTDYEKMWKASLMKNFGFRARETVKELEDGTQLSLGNVTVKFLHFPGHTPGLTGFLIPELEVLFLADMELSPFGPWYHNQKASIQSIIDSVEKIRGIPAKQYIPSHGEEIFRGDIGLRLDRYLENIYSREQKILEALSVPRTLEELVSLSLISGFRLSRRVVWYLFERNMVEKHLERLLARGEICQRGGKYRREGS
ncbi:MAG TPA: MBL fold metallo-hydrolase [Thermodesulfobacteriota bacterium]|nr:MBL fold metallo-hydrolase [Thermodesulfobacteriota bacterium]